MYLFGISIGFDKYIKLPAGETDALKISISERLMVGAPVARAHTFTRTCLPVQPACRKRDLQPTCFSTRADRFAPYENLI
jgi:hypothetical protein